MCLAPETCWGGLDKDILRCHSGRPVRWTREKAVAGRTWNEISLLTEQIWVKSSIGWFGELERNRQTQADLRSEDWAA